VVTGGGDKKKRHTQKIRGELSQGDFKKKNNMVAGKRGGNPGGIVGLGVCNCM